MGLSCRIVCGTSRGCSVPSTGSALLGRIPGPGERVVSDTRLLAKLNGALSDVVTFEGFVQQGYYKSEAAGAWA